MLNFSTFITDLLLYACISHRMFQFLASCKNKVFIHKGILNTNMTNGSNGQCPYQEISYTKPVL